MSHAHKHHIRRSNLKTAIFLNLSFSVFEFIFGLIFNSKMILADAIHDAGDAAVLISMFVSFTLDPMISAYWGDPPPHARAATRSGRGKTPISVQSS